MDIASLWQSVLAEIELSISRPIFQTHFAGSSLVSFEQNVATISVVNPMVRTLVETRYYSLIKSVLDKQAGQNTSLLFVVSSKRDRLTPQNIGPLFTDTVLSASAAAAATARKAHIRPELTFDAYAVSPSNQIAYAAATAVARSPGSAYNPLFVYGGVGVGKTHLMHAIANAMLAKKPTARIVSCMGDEFLNEIIEAIQTKSARLFKQKYRGAELLLVDDVQFIAGKLTAQEEFFHTFNAILREGGQVVLTSDRSPSEISRLEDRLRSRFEGGLLVDVSRPDFELRVAIVNLKSHSMGLGLDPRVSQTIAANTTDARAIEGILKRLTTEAAAGRGEFTPEFIGSLLKSKGAPLQAGAPQPKKRSAQEVLDVVAQYFNVKPSTLKGPKRDRPIARPRQVFMYLTRVELGLTLADIGGALGGRDHTTIMHGVDTITRELSTNPHLREAVEGIKTKLWT